MSLVLAWSAYIRKHSWIISVPLTSRLRRHRFVLLVPVASAKLRGEYWKLRVPPVQGDAIRAV
jgi:hypothetical protein